MKTPGTETRETQTGFLVSQHNLESFTEQDDGRKPF